MMGDHIEAAGTTNNMMFLYQNKQNLVNNNPIYITAAGSIRLLKTDEFVQLSILDILIPTIIYIYIYIYIHTQNLVSVDINKKICSHSNTKHYYPFPLFF